MIYLLHSILFPHFSETLKEIFAYLSQVGTECYIAIDEF